MKMTVEVTRQRALIVILLSVILLFSNLYSLGLGYQYGKEDGYVEGVEYIVEVLEEKLGIPLEIIRNQDGSYTLLSHGFVLPLYLELHMTVRHYRNGVLLSESYHAMSLTTFGKNWIADKLSGASSVNFLANATYIASSNDSSTFSAAWTSIPNEITTDGLSRAIGSVTDTGDGTWNVSKSFSVTGTNSTKLYGLYLNATGNSLVAAEQQGVGSQKNVENGDTLQITVQGTIS